MHDDRPDPPRGEREGPRHGHRKGPPHARKGPPLEDDERSPRHGHRKGPPRKGPPRPSGRHVASSAVTRFIDPARVDALLAPWVPDAHGRAFVVRCILGEGPAHHRGANFVLLSLLGELVLRGGPPVVGAGAPAAPVPLRLPPHLEGALEDDAFPLSIPTGPLERLAPAGSPELEAMLDCLSDGPPQHALANAAMVALLGVLLDRADG
jgi:hypothetical protein